MRIKLFCREKWMAANALKVSIDPYTPDSILLSLSVKDWLFSCSGVQRRTAIGLGRLAPD
jgi:hypothetical protein